MRQSGPSNGHPRVSGRTVARDVGELAHDVITLAELQADLLSVDLRDFGKHSVAPTVALVSGLVIALSGFPVLLLSLAYVLIEVAQLSTWLAMLIAAGVGFVLGALIAYGSWKALQARSHVMRRSREELQQNIRWIKTVLKHRHSETPPV